MNDKMRRFLISIGIDSVERFDLDFDIVTRNQYNRNQIDMLIVKERPWSFELLEEFQNHLETVKYPYSIKFSYLKKPNASDATKLFADWHYTHCRYNSNLKLIGIANTITVYYESIEEKNKNSQVMKDFASFLEFLNYNFTIEHKIIEKSQEFLKETPKQEVQKEMSEDEEKTLKAFQSSVTEMRHELERNPYASQSWKDRIPYKKIDDFSKLNEDSTNVEVEGQLYGIDKPKIIRNGKTMLTCGLGKGEHAISLKLMENDNLTPDFMESLKNESWARVKGYVQRDFRNNLTIDVRTLEVIEGPELRKDDEEEKRVELHLHTKMSAMDGVTSTSDYFKLALNMGHKALAVTDHGVVQSFPEAQAAQNKTGVKALYGVEFYMVNDELPFALNPVDVPLGKATYVVFDLETTGLSTRYDKITEFGGIRFENGQIVKTLQLLVNPERKIPLAVQEKTHITDEMVKDKPTIEQCIDQILDFMDGAILVSHNITFDYGFIAETLKKMGREPFVKPAIDTLSLSRYLFPDASAHRLGNLSRNLGMDDYNDEEAHRADYDARILNEVWLAMLHRLQKMHGENMLHSDLSKIKSTNAMLKHMRPAHVTAIAKNEAGVKDLFELVSLSHIDYLADVPKIPKREIERLRSNLIIGSACQNGEVFEIERTRSKDDLLEAMKWYDYIEVQPADNYVNLINRGQIANIEQVKAYISDIVECADSLGKMVVATGDVHYANPEDKISRDIYIAAKAVGGKFHPLHLKDSSFANPDQHYRTTREMLDAFYFLGPAKAKEIVIKNTNLIADSTDLMAPIHTKLEKPEIKDSDKMLIDACFDKAHKLYGEEIPQDIVDRLNKELEGINGNGYSVTYYIAHEIIRRANEDGYMVGSRGSVGSSLAAFLYDVTEVNPLAPHYRCPKCRHFEYSNDPNCYSGSDLPEKKCPVCGEPMVHDGQEIPFETFLGFHAEKVPDIDLNFPSDYQAKAHNLTKDIFGEHNVFRAGTISTVADKTAFGYVRNYFEAKGIDPSSIPGERVAYMASHCTEVKRTTGQHPGGIVVLPKGRSIYEFTPIQYPADDKEADWFTTHLDYHAALDAQLLKLDLLGHVDPLALRLMSLMTGVDVKKIPLNDKKVISLFTSTKALNLSENYLKTKIGSSGLPEYGTETCRDILLKAKPKTFAEVVAVAGLAHGTNVWQHNQEDLIREGTMDLHNCVAARDDIMRYLIAHKVPSEVAFETMEKVRKGKKIPEKNLPILREAGIPEYYIEACNKIKYLYPKAHAVAYATMAVRVGYFKVYYPLEFYAVWFSVRCDAYDIFTMLAGFEKTKERYDQLTRLLNDRTQKTVKKDEDLHAMLEVCIEMFERGFKFGNIDLYKSDATKFICDHENGLLIPPFIVIDGLGEAAANSVVEARANGEFKSKEDLLKRTKLNGTNVEDLDALGVLKGLGDTDQMSLFEFGLGD